MKSRYIITLLLTTLFAVSMGCDSEPPELGCFDAPDNVVKFVSNTLLPFGNGPELRASKVLKSDVHPTTFFVATELHGAEYPGSDDIAIWALYDTADGDQMIWVNRLALDNSIAGRALEARYDITDKEVLEVRDCVRDVFQKSLFVSPT